MWTCGRRVDTGSRPRTRGDYPWKHGGHGRPVRACGPTSPASWVSGSSWRWSWGSVAGAGPAIRRRGIVGKRLADPAGGRDRQGDRRRPGTKAGVKPARPATDEEFLRRAYLDLLGRIPNVQEARAFLGIEGDRQAGQAGRVPAQPSRLRQEFRDPVDGPADRPRQPGPDGRPRRADSWLRKQFGSRPALERDRPRAGHGHRVEQGERRGQLTSLAHLEFGAVPLTSRTTRLFLGQQIQCTQCHDHPSNDWKQADFWGINAFFKGIKTRGQSTRPNATGGEVVRPHRAERRADRRLRPATTSATAWSGSPSRRFLDGRKISQGTDVIRRAELGKLIADPKNEALAKAFVNRMWAPLPRPGLRQSGR